MDFFEIALIFFFIVLPLIEGIARKKKGDKAPPAPRPTPRRPPSEQRREARGSERPPRSEPTEAGPAAEMLPDDLWEVLTGERRGGASHGPTTAEPETARAPEPLEDEGRWASESDWDDGLETGEVGEEEIGGDEIVAPWDEPDRTRSPATSVEYAGPEAYSLETPPPPPDVRHRRFHEMMDALPPPERIRRPSLRRKALRRALATPAGLRQAVLMKEILGSPKGLD